MDAEHDTMSGRPISWLQYQYFYTKRACRILARDSGRQSVAWGGAQRNPRYDYGLLRKPVERATAFKARSSPRLSIDGSHSNACSTLYR